ncbi:Clp protease ClpP [Eubacterium sp. am_0171]|uniref:head maturation protease, ClpP-related n=1 Tax=Clostridia TaxID=186801 RepID=UPI00101F51B3|nr:MULTISPECIES: head maturation protease, ClpP-related [Clostridia]MSC84360.1 Clp protease ClpP [Eubacterium sp. BIOML-A1]MSD05906.1 Clp protease ClpP [Eubacterium sp. BIOML-A2]RYT23276.1 Clp protease ClpP [Eubacterium sp. am_0171]
MKTAEIRGDIISNDLKWIYDWLEWESTCPNDIKKVIEALEDGEELRVTVNSGGGDVFAGQEIYTLLRKSKNSVAEIDSLAGSAAGVAAMGAAQVLISPVAMIMIHNVSMSGRMSGDYHLYEKNANALKEMNAAMAQSYSEKSGKSVNEILEIMDRETWLTANQAVEMGFADEILGADIQITNSYSGLRLTEEIKQRVLQEKAETDENEKLKNELICDLDMYGV